MNKKLALIFLPFFYNLGYAEIKTAGALRTFWTTLSQKQTKNWTAEEATEAKKAFDTFASNATIRAIKPNFDQRYADWLTTQQQQLTIAELNTQVINLTKALADTEKKRDTQIRELKNQLRQETERKVISEQEKKLQKDTIDTLTKSIAALEQQQKETDKKRTTLENSLAQAQAGKAGAEQELNKKIIALQEELSAAQQRVIAAEQFAQEAKKTIKTLQELSQTQEALLAASSTRSKQLEEQAKAGTLSRESTAQLLVQEQAIREQIKKELAEKYTEIQDLIKTQAQLSADILEKEKANTELKEAHEIAQKALLEAENRAKKAEAAQKESAAIIQQLQEAEKKLTQEITAAQTREQELEKRAQTEKDALKKELMEASAESSKQAAADIQALRAKLNQQESELQSAIEALKIDLAGSKTDFDKEKAEAQSATKALQEAQATLKKARTHNAHNLLRLVVLRRTKQKSEDRVAQLQQELKSASGEQQQMLRDKLAQEEAFNNQITQLKTQEEQNRKKTEAEIEKLRTQSLESDKKIALYEKQIETLKATTRQAIEQRKKAEEEAKQKIATLNKQLQDLEKIVLEKKAALEKLGKEKTAERAKLEQQIKDLQAQISGIKQEQPKQSWLASWFGSSERPSKGGGQSAAETSRGRREEAKKEVEMQEIETPTEKKTEEPWGIEDIFATTEIFDV